MPLSYICSECSAEAEHNDILHINFCREHGLTAIPVIDCEALCPEKMKAKA